MASGQNPNLRREWRTLRLDERQDFVTAVHCLAHSPSGLGLNTSRYDDFVYVHVMLYNESK